MDKEDKEWARKYILDPLTAPEPSEETGPGSSFYNPARASLSQNKQSGKGSSDNHSNSSAQRRQSSSQGSKSDVKLVVTPPPQTSRSDYPTPPGSASPSQESNFYSRNPYRSSSSKPSSNGFSPPLSPERGDSKRASSTSGHRRAVSNGFFAPPDRSSSAHPPGSPSDGAGIRRSASTRTYDAPPSYYQHRSGLRGRYPGDMSHRPLEMLAKHNRKADRDYHRHKPRQLSDTDTIDALDTIGGAYHHGGPYDATLLSRNMHKKYSPVAAVEESNQEAIKATPQEYITDSLTHHRPLQGTSTIPSGQKDLRGNIMEYEEGTDLMREPIGDMGAYKQWPGIQYHPDDLKGKGEPSFSIDRDRKANKQRLDHLLAPGNYELQPGVNKDVHTGRQRSVSNSNAANANATSSGSMFGQLDGGVRRSNTTGKRLSEGIKRRFGSIRKRSVEL